MRVSREVCLHPCVQMLSSNVRCSCRAKQNWSSSSTVKLKKKQKRKASCSGITFFLSPFSVA